MQNLSENAHAARSELRIVCIADRFAPLVFALRPRNLHGDVAEPSVPLCAVPVLDIGRDRDDRTGLEADSGPPLLLLPALAGRADQELAAGGPESQNFKIFQPIPKE